MASEYAWMVASVRGGRDSLPGTAVSPGSSQTEPRIAVFAAGEGTEIDSLPSGAPLDDPTFLPAQRAAHQTAGSAIQSAPGRLKWPDLAAAPLRFRGPGKFFYPSGRRQLVDSRRGDPTG